MGAKCLKPRHLRGCSAIRVAKERTTPDKGSFGDELAPLPAKISGRPRRRRIEAKLCFSKIADKPESLSYIEALGSVSGLSRQGTGADPAAFLYMIPGAGKRQSKPVSVACRPIGTEHTHDAGHDCRVAAIQEEKHAGLVEQSHRAWNDRG